MINVTLSNYQAASEYKVKCSATGCVDVSGEGFTEVLDFQKCVPTISISQLSYPQRIQAIFWDTMRKQEVKVRRRDKVSPDYDYWSSWLVVSRYPPSF